MEQIFCDQNVDRQAEHGGILTDSQTSQAALEHIQESVDRWKEAFDDPERLRNVFVKFLDFDKTIVNAILNQEGCVSLRIYPGLNENGKLTMALVGVNENFEDIIDINFIDNLKVCCCPRNGKSTFFK